ncbi:MAG: mannonate oxidoreductase [Bacteroidia bacterium]|nr:MAG: mannonate oxidoreductase [Bacteroidia bacterium]
MKKWKIGDKVKFLNEKGGGIITAIKDAFYVIVQLPDGMEIPYPASELIPDNKNIIFNPSVSSLHETNTDNKVVYLAIESNSAKVSIASEFYVYLYNLSDYNLYYTYSIGKNNTFQSLAHGNIQGFEKQRIKTHSVNFLKDIDAIQIQIIFYQENLFVTQSPVFETVKINEKTFSPSQFIQHPEFEKPVFIILLKDNFSLSASEIVKSQSSQNIRVHLSDVDLKKIQQLKEKPFYSTQKQSQSVRKHQDELILDLHIEELVENPGNLSAHQKLQIQLDVFQKEIHNAIAQHVRKITIIHGVGNGRLKYEVREYLKTLSEVKSIEDAPYKLYGFGATDVYLK